MCEIDIRIMCVPERLDNVKRINEILKVPEEKIFIDTSHAGVIPNAKKAWLAPTDKDYIMVLNDDLIFCNGFLDICNKIIKAVPNSIISLFPMQFQSRETIRSGGKPTISPYVETDILSGVGIIMPTKYVKPCIESWLPDAICDDTSISLWAKKNNIPIITTLPATIQHIGDRSFFNPGRPPIMTEFFEGNPEANWDNPYVTSWTNLIR